MKNPLTLQHREDIDSAAPSASSIEPLKPDGLLYHQKTGTPCRFAHNLPALRVMASFSFRVATRKGASTNSGSAANVLSVRTPICLIFSTVKEPSLILKFRNRVRIEDEHPQDLLLLNSVRSNLTNLYTRAVVVKKISEGFV